MSRQCIVSALYDILEDNIYELSDEQKSIIKFVANDALINLSCELDLDLDCIELLGENFVKMNKDGKMYDEDAYQYIKNVSDHGCSSGVAPTMMYYCDTENFFDKYSTGILDFLEYNRLDFGELPKDLSFNKNDLAWFAYEDAAYKILLAMEENY